MQKSAALLSAIALLVFGLLLSRQLAAEPAKEEKAPGLRLTIEGLTKEAGKDVRTARLVALSVPTGEAPSPLVSAGPFRATWDGELLLDLKGDIAFSVEGRGKLKVQINGDTLFDIAGDDFGKTPPKQIALRRGPNPIVVRYESPEKGDARIRLLWASSEFYREPLSFLATEHNARAKDLVAHQRLREGREVVARFHCLKCHTADIKPAMPEAEQDAPSLAEIGGRVHEAWLARWIADPQALRPSATMPKLFPTKDGVDPRARDIAAYLATLGKADARPEKAADEETVHLGGRLFAHLGCIACHLPPGKDEIADEEHQRIPLRFVAAKWQPAALRDFLKQPDQHYQWVRMPNFHLSDDEIAKLSAILLAPEKKDLAVAGKGDPVNGKKLLETSGCLNCHSLTADRKLAGTVKAVPLPKVPAEGWGRGCINPNPERAPQFALTGEQRETVAEFVLAAWPSLARDSAIDFAARQMKALRCNACHKRDLKEDHWSELKEEAGGILAEHPGDDPEKDPTGQTFPPEQNRPPLTWVGEKLKPEWLRAFLAGDVKYKPRPFLRARMPTFPRQAAGLARGLVLEHGGPPQSPADPPVDAQLADAGLLLASKKFWGCAGCHNVGKQIAAAAFEAPGVNFMVVKERLRPDYFDRWLWNPSRLEPGTKMPSAYTIGQPSQIKDILDGDARKQIDALWQYLQTGDKIKHPDP